jgi:glycine cleavage system aminomethyltransferase T
MLFKADQVAGAQHAAVRNNVGWYRWNHDLLEVTGADATRFLDYIFVNSIAKAPVGGSKYTTMLNEAGQIIDDVIVTHMGENAYWVSTLYGPELMAWINQKKGDLDVTYRELTREVAMYAAQGPRAKDLINRLVAAPVDALKRFAMTDTTIGDIPVKIHRGGFTGELGYEIYCAMPDSQAIEQAIEEAGKALDAVKLTVLEVYVRSLPGEKGLMLRQDLYGLTLYEADLGWSVDLSKEFIGKEAVVRAKEAGPKRKLVGLEFEAESYEDISQGERIRFQGVDVGWVRAIMYGYTVDKNIGFGIVDAKKAAVGTRVQVGPNNTPAVVVARRWV